MNYAQIYDYTYRRTMAESKKLIISKLEKSKKKNRPFKTINNSILNWLYNYNKKLFTDKFNNNESEAYSIFIKRHTLYEGERLEIIQWVLDEEVKKLFKGYNYASYSSFIRELAMHEALSEISRHYLNYYSYYELIYEQNKYEYFFLKDFDKMGFESSEEYNKMMDEKYPNRIEQRNISKSNKRALKTVIDKTLENPNDFEDDITKCFTDDERMLMINVFHNLVKNNQKREIPLTSLIKLIKIAGSFESDSVFYDKAQSNTLYSKANKGIHYYTGKSQIDIINSTIKKLDEFGIDFITDTLKMQIIKLRSQTKS